jgi:hypothetical protein
MKHHPILFSTEMVRAIQEGTKTQTRRVVKPQPDVIENGFVLTEREDVGSKCFIYNDRSDGDLKELFCPYGKPGDVLWVREKWRPLVDCKTGEKSFDFYAEMPDDFHKQYPRKWKPSIHMPKDSARIWLLITHIRLERLQTISEDDAIAEGIAEIHPAPFIIRWKDYLSTSLLDSPYWSFYSLWCKINGIESWKSNPWVWVVEFEKIEKPSYK